MSESADVNYFALNHSRKYSDLELLRGGASIDNGVLRPTPDQLGKLALNPPGEQPGNLPMSIFDVNDEITATYWRNQGRAFLPYLNPQEPKAYLQAVRDYNRLNINAPNTEFYFLRRAYMKSILAIDLNDYWQWYEYGNTQDLPSLQGSNGTLPGNHPAYKLQRGFIEVLYGATRRLTKDVGSTHNENVPIAFGDMPISMQRPVIIEAGKEAERLMQCVDSYGASIDSSFEGRMYTLSIRPVEDLIQAIARRPEIEPQRIIRAFFHRTNNFSTYVDSMLTGAEQKERRALAPRTRATLSKREVAVRERIQQALLLPAEKQFNDLEVGTIKWADYAEQADLMVCSALLNLESVAADLYGPSFGNCWSFARVNRSFFEMALPKKFYGKMLNPRLVVMPITDAYLESYLKNKVTEGIEPTSFSRLNLIVDLHSTGRGIIGQSIVDIIMYTRHANDPTRRLHMLSAAKAADGDKIVDYMNYESNAIAHVVLEHAIKNPELSGLMRPR